ncbi:(Fe-S)-binding protein [Peptostreptococcus faecalis]|uniref:(Fe-S)-binding protein n=1 Tax=Peptostreptococcus faecalis TaxID=2045015 RepID=UPI0011AF6098|nr:(Fe-S)-binding protein [Peptostreptococcus faecalis]
MIDIENKISKDCIHCGLCTQNCDFLEKYDMCLQSFEDKPELAYNCFLCGKCKIVCPMDIDGREIALSMRKDHIENNSGKINSKGYSGLIAEKQNYIFKNYKKVGKGKSALFTGCNLLSYMPNTANKLIDELHKHDIGVIFDCCGKPIAELGFEEKEKIILEKLNDKFKKNNIEELITACPNCYYYLNGKVDVKIVDIYTKLHELGIGNEIEREKIYLFRPCPDRETEEVKEKLYLFAKNSKLVDLNEQCCGAGGVASVKESELAQGFRDDIKKQSKDKQIHTYCSTCTGFFRAEGINVTHILTEILGVDESKPGISLLNRLKYKFY